MKKSRIWNKALGFILVGFLIAIIFTLTDTYSLFQASNSGYGQVTAAVRDDIISNMEIFYQNHVPIIRLEKSENVDYSPIIFFSIEGDAKDYILHVNSVKVDDVIETPIIPNVNLPQALALILNPKNEIQGEVKIKHLNEFIDDTLEFTFTKKYLLSKYFCNRNIEVHDIGHISGNEKNELGNLVRDTLLYAKEYLVWDAAQWVEKGNWISKINIARDQASLVNILAPDLLKYNERLYELFEMITVNLDEEIEKNNELYRENQELVKVVRGLEEDNRVLENYISTLEVEIGGLLERLNREEEKLEDPETEEKPDEPEELPIPKAPEDPEKVEDLEASENSESEDEMEILETSGYLNEF